MDNQKKLKQDPQKDQGQEGQNEQGSVGGQSSPAPGKQQGPSEGQGFQDDAGALEDKERMKEIQGSDDQLANNYGNWEEDDAAK